MPMRPDEDVYGITYEQIDDYLEGKPVAHSAAATIVRAYQKGSHRRGLPRHFYSLAAMPPGYIGAPMTGLR